MARKDLTGQVFGELTVIEFKELDKRRNAKWICKCSCGKETIVSGDSLRRGATKSCGKCQYYSKTKDLTGQKFGRLTVLSLSHVDKEQRLAIWNVICDCGKTLTVRGTNLSNKHTVSCGCYKLEKAKKTKDFTGKVFGRLTVIREVKRAKDVVKLLCKCSCGTLKVIDRDSLTQGVTKSCGCLFKEKMKGENNPSYKHGKSKENHKERTTTKYENWRKQVFERDNYTCQKCNKRGTKLHAHHIRSFATNPKLRTDLKNGVTLCEHCHLSFHARFGKHDNNKRQLNSFMKLPI